MTLTYEKLEDNVYCLHGVKPLPDGGHGDIRKVIDQGPLLLRLQAEAKTDLGLIEVSDQELRDA